MRSLISEVIKRTPLKDVKHAPLVGDDHVLARVEPKEFASAEQIAKVVGLFGTTKVGSCHEPKGFDAKTVVECSDSSNFPILQQTTMKMKIGVLGGRQVAVVDGFRDLCGPAECSSLTTRSSRTACAPVAPLRRRPSSPRSSGSASGSRPVQINRYSRAPALCRHREGKFAGISDLANYRLKNMSLFVIDVYFLIMSGGHIFTSL